MPMQENDSTIIDVLNATLTQSDKEIDWETIQDQLAVYINELILTDFNKLMSILYQIDVSEAKIRKALATNQGQHNAGEILASFIIDRQLQKIRFRRKYKG
jgi:hypothetical protein